MLKRFYVLTLSLYFGFGNSLFLFFTDPKCARVSVLLLFSCSQLRKNICHSEHFAFLEDCWFGATFVALKVACTHARLWLFKYSICLRWCVKETARVECEDDDNEVVLWWHWYNGGCFFTFGKIDLFLKVNKKLILNNQNMYFVFYVF